MNKEEQGAKNVKEGTEERAARGVDARRVARAIAPSLLFGLCGYFSGLVELPFGARPFGISLLAASGRGTVFVYLGLIIGAFSTMELDAALVYFGVYTALIMARVFSRVFVELRSNGARSLRFIGSNIFCERTASKTLISALFGVALGTAVLLGGGLLYYDLIALLIISLSAPLTTTLICGYTRRREKEKKSEWLAIRRDVGFTVICAIAIYGARELVLYGVSVAVFVIILLTFFVTRQRGVGYGAILGLALGLCYSPMLAPMFVISALCAGILMRLSVTLACFSAFFTSCAWAFYVEGMSALLGVFGGILAGCLIYSALDKVIFDGLVREAESEGERSDGRTRVAKCRVLPDGVLDGIRLYEMNLRASAISDGLYRLSLFLDKLKGESFLQKQSGEFCDEKYNSELWGDVSAPDYRAISALLANAMEIESGEYEIDRELSRRLSLALSKLDLELDGVLVYGVRKKTIYILSKERSILEENAKTIIAATASASKLSLDAQSYDLRRDGSERGGALLIFEREKSSVSVVRRRVIAQNESVCGDSSDAFESKDNRFFAFISDGMGSGQAASSVSQICSGFLLNMLDVGGVSRELISMLNGFLCGRARSVGSECSATLDIFELDLMSGRSLLYKCGAAPSYVYRKGRLFKLRSSSMPIGILREVDVKRFELELSRGDVVVMVSDGVTGEGGECPWLFDLLVRNLPSRGLERCADLIVKYATAAGSVDDISVMLIRIE